MTDTTTGTATKQSMGLVLTASAAGTVFEWYDFFVFGSLTAIIAKHFYAGAGDTQSYILTLLTFAAGFLVRPFGAIVFGHIGDRTGRKRAFLVTITIMGLATFAMGVLPDYSQIGVIAPYALVAMRVLQGFAVGGEYGGAAIYVAEHTDAGKRGLSTGWIQASATTGLFLALSVVLITRTQMGEDTFAAWGWRIPFLVSMVLLIVSLLIRMRLQESPVYQKMRAEGRGSQAPLSEAFLQWPNLKIVLMALFSVLMAQGVIWYTAQFYTQVFLERVMKVEPRMVNFLVLTVTFLSAPLHVFFAWLSDKVGRKPVILFGLALATLTVIPGFKMLTEAVNPALVTASTNAPVTVIADPANCSVQFDPVGKTKFVSSCDIAKSTLANAGVPYTNEAAPSGTVAHIRVGGVGVSSFEGSGLDAAALTDRKKAFDATVSDTLKQAGYRPKAASDEVNTTKAILVLLMFIIAAAAIYGPQAAALVELFPTRIRYTALSVPYHIGVGWFGGLLPTIVFAINVATGNVYAGLWYPVIVAGMSFVVALFFLPETRGRSIDN
ncbi:MAG TPA: MFS transporter [Rhizomicrobium sp.]|nr:MFS transporter [Rhizomicrobium sp.]